MANIGVGVHLVVQLPPPLLLGHLRRRVDPPVALDEVRRLAYRDVRHFDRRQRRHDLAELARHEPPHPQPLEQLGDGVLGAVIRAAVVAREQQPVALGENDEPFLLPRGRQARGMSACESPGAVLCARPAPTAPAGAASSPTIGSSAPDILRTYSCRSWAAAATFCAATSSFAGLRAALATTIVAFGFPVLHQHDGAGPFGHAQKRDHGNDVQMKEMVSHAPAFEMKALPADSFNRYRRSWYFWWVGRVAPRLVLTSGGASWRMRSRLFVSRSRF